MGGAVQRLGGVGGDPVVQLQTNFGGGKTHSILALYHLFATAAHRGLEDRRVKLGCLMPGESPAVFGDALRRLAGAATYLYQDGPRYWYSTQPTVTKLAEDRAEQLKRDPDQVVQALDQRLRADLRQPGDFSRIHPLPQSGQDVPDDRDARLVVLGLDHSYTKEAASPAETAAKAILDSRGNAPRLYRNALVFLAADKTRLQDLDESVRRWLAWESILGEKDTLDLTPHQVKQAETQQAAADSAITARLPETYQWLLVPTQASPQAAVEWQATRLSGQDSLAARASKKLRSNEALIAGFGPTLLRMELDRVPLWRGDHVDIKQLVEDFARYLYLRHLGAMAGDAGAARPRCDNTRAKVLEDVSRRRRRVPTRPPLHGPIKPAPLPPGRVEARQVHRALKDADRALPHAVGSNHEPLTVRTARVEEAHVLRVARAPVRPVGGKEGEQLPGGTPREFRLDGRATRDEGFAGGMRHHTSSPFPTSLPHRCIACSSSAVVIVASRAGSIAVRVPMISRLMFSVFLSPARSSTSLAAASLSR